MLLSQISLRSIWNPENEAAHFPMRSIQKTTLWQKAQCTLEV
uniref:Uncharacterized protein n=1 Tax=Arundo donax TaxID=35708 RepID=A0A0A9DB69_ARUDO